MSVSKNEQAPSPQLEFHLSEFEDYIYEDEILGVIVAKLKEAGLYKPGLLAVGYAQSGEGSLDPTWDVAKTWAYTLETWEKRAENDGDTPLSYAQQALADDGDKMAIGVYDPEVLKEEMSNLYSHHEGLSVDEAKLATFIVEARQ